MILISTKHKLVFRSKSNYIYFGLKEIYSMGGFNYFV